MHEQLTDLWDQRWSKVHPSLPYRLKTEYQDQWVRFHCLPESKRNPETEFEYEIVLSRYGAVMDELFSGQIHVVTAVYTSSPDWPGEEEPSRIAQAPMEGGLDAESFRAIADVLRSFDGPKTVVLAHWTEAVIHEPYTVFRGRLADLEALEALEVGFSPSNIWPEDKSWLIYTDWDLWGTKIYGPPDLLDMIEADAFLETARLPDYRRMLMSPKPSRATSED